MEKRRVVWLEMATQDRLKTAQFYADVFGVETKDYPDMHYTTLATGNSELGIGIGNPSEELPGGGATIYFESKDLEADLATIRAHGGEVVLEPMEVPGIGTMAFFKDPGGNLMAIANFVTGT